MTDHPSPPIPATLLELAEEWSPLFKLLGDPTRLRLLLAMHYVGPGKASVGELAELTDIRVPTASAALTHMATVGVLVAERQGREVRYSLTDQHAHEVLHYLGATHSTPHGGHSR
ncbi:MAG: metalloregulator ArsR/SmtB family transcription factor [Corynebacterium sp.]|uniref:ArsR/SmtB family transcription factor n=1 Tax=Corynebacterium sp. TaxID=1720 RepID=UPI00270659A1|nr:metalloregulator ArsR/SmtB family transcription factor [Corynebacterium sp.]